VAALTMTTPTAAGVAWSPAAVSASDTISDAQLGTGGCYLVVINGGGSSDTVTVADGGVSPAGNAGTALTNAVANGTSEVMYISPKLKNSSLQVVVTHSFTTSVTYVLLPAVGG
jgi:ApbE superfamily uncharacterized protein (UPF0280 family)